MIPLPQIATLGPDPAPIAGDISYEYEDYDYNYDTIQNIQVCIKLLMAKVG